MCVLPWIHLATHPNGGCSLCCRSNHTDAISWAKKEDSHSLALLDNSSIPEVLNSQKFVEVRRAMLNGQRSPECEGCWQDEDSGIESKRQYENRRWSHIIEELENSAVIHRPNYRYIELRLGNVCNNACLTCNSYSSSRWYPDEKVIASDLSWFDLRPQENFKWFESEEFYDELTQYSEGVEEIYINGGEPTLIKAHFRYLKNLIENGTSQKVHLVYSLNMMDIPASLVELWKSFKQVTVNASIDDLYERNYYIRYPSKWHDTVRSINILTELDNVEWHVTQTVSIFNIDNLHNFSAWLKHSYNKKPQHNYVLYPDYLSLAVLPEDYKAQLMEFYSDQLDAHQRNDLFAKLSIKYDQELAIKAKEFITAVDKARSLCYTVYLPHLSKIFNEINYG
jgi:organic radical activating enzyme